MLKLTLAAILVALASLCPGANLTYSTYLRDGFTPTAMTSDAQGNLYLGGSAVIDPASGTTSAVVAKLDAKASRYLYLEYLDSAASDSISAIAVDAAGNLFVAGTTSNTAFPVTSGNGLGALPTGPTDTRAFVTKLNPNGVVLFSTLLGGFVTSHGYGIAITPQGQILVSGVSGSGFAATPGAFSVPDTTGKWFLVELDPTGSKVIFSATGIGGSSLALDAAGNVFMAGSSQGTDYPTTAGAYQTTFKQGHICYGLCQVSFPGELQHLTKVDPGGSKLIYSTGINDSSGGAGSTVNTGLAVDAAGNAYVTGTLLEAGYPFTVSNPTSVSGGFLSKVDPTGKSLLFSEPVGGAGVLIDSAGALYAAGTVSTYNPVGFPGLAPLAVVTLPDALSWIPAPCVPNTVTGTQGAYLLKLDAATGNILDAQWIDGASATASAVALVGTRLWAAGVSASGDVPTSPGALGSTNLPPGPLLGAFLSAADFSVPPAPANGAPVIACLLDAGNLTHAGPVAAYQILSIFGANLGPATGVPAPDGTDPSIAGVTVTFDGNPARMTYVSSSQINVMVPVPAPSRDVVPYPSSTVMQISLNGTSIQRQIPLTVYNLNLFAEVGSIATGCPASGSGVPGFQPVALNADRSRNSCSNPAKFGSLISVFVHGVGAQQLGLAMPDTVSGIVAQIGSCVANVETVARSGIVYQVDVRLPPALLPCTGNFSTNTVSGLSLTLTYNGLPVGPLVLNSTVIPARSRSMLVWATP